MKIKRVKMGMFCVATILSLIFWLTTATAFAQTETAKIEVQENAEQTILQPVLTEYKGIKIGMTSDEVREKLDKKPKVADNDGLFYVFSDEESVQIGLDADKKVRVISIMYAGKNAEVPKYEDVFGKDIALSKTEDGRIYNLVRYPESGFWVAYSQTAGDNPMTTITIQKMWNAK